MNKEIIGKNNRVQTVEFRVLGIPDEIMRWAHDAEIENKQNPAGTGQRAASNKNIENAKLEIL